MNINTLLKKTNQKGESLVAIMVGVGILSIAMMTLVSMLTTMQKEIRSINEKLDINELKSYLQFILKDGSVCLFELNDPAVLTFDSSSATTTAHSFIDINQIHTLNNSTSPLAIQTGAIVPNTSSTKSLYIDKIRLKNFALHSLITSTIAKFWAEWEISFDSSKLVRSLQPIRIKVLLTTDNSLPSATKITSCEVI